MSAEKTTQSRTARMPTTARTWMTGLTLVLRSGCSSTITRQASGCIADEVLAWRFERCITCRREFRQWWSAPATRMWMAPCHTHANDKSTCCPSIAEVYRPPTFKPQNQHERRADAILAIRPHTKALADLLDAEMSLCRGHFWVEPITGIPPETTLLGASGMDKAELDRLVAAEEAKEAQSPKPSPRPSVKRRGRPDAMPRSPSSRPPPRRTSRPMSRPFPPCRASKTSRHSTASNMPFPRVRFRRTASFPFAACALKTDSPCFTITLSNWREKGMGCAYANDEEAAQMAAEWSRMNQ